MKSTEYSFEWNLVGNDHIKEYLEKSIIKGSIAGSYIFKGPDNLGKTTLALNFAKALLCQSSQEGVRKIPCNDCPACRLLSARDDRNTKGAGAVQEALYPESRHGDLHIIKREKDKKNISITQVREFIKSLGMSSFLNSYKIGIIKHADSLNEEASNALLKTLEEPKNKVVVILITTNLESLPATIVSRSQVLAFREVKADDLYEHMVNNEGVDRVKAKIISRLSLGRPALAKKFGEDREFHDSYNQRLEAFVNFFDHDINQRFSFIEELLGRKAKGQELAKIGNRIIEIWQGAARDLVLLRYNHNDLLQHQAHKDKFFEINSKLKIEKLLGLCDVLSRSKEYIKANVSPRSVLEYISLSI